MAAVGWASVHEQSSAPLTYHSVLFGSQWILDGLESVSTSPGALCPAPPVSVDLWWMPSLWAAPGAPQSFQDEERTFPFEIWLVRNSKSISWAVLFGGTWE